jgi:hypothetical protein
MNEKQFIIEASMRICAANTSMPVKDVVDTAETLWDEICERGYDEDKALEPQPIA